VSSQAFLPGDQILLKCGETWTDTLVLDDVGQLGNEIRVQPYGTCSASSVVTLANTSAEQIHFASGAAHIIVSDITFSDGTGVVLDTASNVLIEKSRFMNMSGSAIYSSGIVDGVFQDNYFKPTASGTAIESNGDLRLNITNNTISDGFVWVDILNSVEVIVSGNTFFNPYSYAVVVEEDTTVPAGTMQMNSISSNTLLTWNVDYPMIRMNDQNDAIGMLADLSNNTYLNVYKAVLPLVEIMWSGASAVNYNKDDIGTLDLSAVTFTNFGYRNYVSTGVLNPRTNEAKLLVNTGSSAASMACPGGPCTQYVTIATPNSNSTFPANVWAYGSKIVLWRDTLSGFTPGTILYPPTGTFNPSLGSVPNNDPIDLTWNISNANTVVVDGETYTGSFSTPVASSGSMTLTPPESATTTYSITATNDIGTFFTTADVVTTNSPPIPITGYFTGAEDSVVITGAVIATDTNSGGSVTYSLFDIPPGSQWTVNLLSDGTFDFYPTGNFCGVSTFQFRAVDAYLLPSDPANANITVTCVNDAPIAVDDTMSATGGQLAILDVTTNDTDIDTIYEAQTYTVSWITLPAEGTLVANGATFEYTPNFVYMGTDSFTYVTIDQSGAISNTGTVTINVAPGMNLAPTASSGIYMLNEDDSVLGTLSGSDLNGDILSFSAITLPTNGILTIMGTGFSYVPNANFNGSDSFDFVANDGFLDSNVATMTLNVNQVSDVPVAVDDTINVQMDTVTNIDVVVNDTDGDNPYQPQTLTLTGISTPTNGTASIVGNDIQYTPNSLYLGSDIIEYVIEDQDGNLSNTGIVNITVSTTNQYPVADSGSFMVTEDIPLTQTLSGSDPDLTPVTFVLDTDVSNGTLVLSATWEFTYTPDTDYNGTDSFTFHVTDGIFNSNPIQTVTLTVTAENDNPFAAADALSVAEDSYLDSTVLTNDSDADIGDTFVINSVTSPINGTAVMSGSLITYTPNSNYCGLDTFEYTTIDLSGATSNVGSVTMTVTCMNDTPSANNLSFTATGNVATSTGNILIGTLSGTDIDAGDILTYTIVQDVLSGTLLLTGSTFSYEWDIDFIGTDTFIYTATDLSGALSNTGTVTITVVPNDYNAVPVAYSGTFTMNEDDLLTDVLSGSDLEGGSLTYILDQNVGSGVLNMSATGGFVYSPNANFHGTDSFTFHVYDGEFVSAIVSATITVNSVNDIPTVVDDSDIGSEEGVFVINPIINDSDADGDTISLNAYTPWINGIVTASGNTLTYTPNANYCGTETISYTNIDSNSAVSATGTITLILSCVNDAPIATGETVSATEDTALTIAVLANDTDVELSTLSVANLTQPGSGGTVAISGTGVIFTPTANFCTANPTTFTYQARDTGLALSAVTTVTISAISCVNDTPTSSNTSYSMTGNVVVNSGTILSGGTLTGYVATANTLVRTLTSTDIDGDTVTFSGITFPTHGTGTLSATGLLTYIPTPSYIGNDSMTFHVADGTGTSIVYTITLVVQDPNPPVVVITTPTTGPGGGGGGNHAGYSVISGTYKSSTSVGTSTGLTSQLLLTNSKIKKTSSSGMITVSYDSFILPIVQVIEEAKVDPESSKERAAAIRQSGQKLMYSLTRSVILTAVEKAQAIKSAEAELSSMSDSVEPSRESRALNFIIRVMKRERAKIEKSVNAVTYLMTL
jgi:VCBS repeat-containing protein